MLSGADSLSLAVKQFAEPLSMSRQNRKEPPMFATLAQLVPTLSGTTPVLTLDPSSVKHLRVSR